MDHFGKIRYYGETERAGTALGWLETKPGLVWLQRPCVRSMALLLVQRISISAPCSWLCLVTRCTTVPVVRRPRFLHGFAIARGMWVVLHEVQVVGGSNPLAPTKEIKALQAMLVRPFCLAGGFCPHVCPHTTGGSRGNGAEFLAGTGERTRSLLSSGRLCSRVCRCMLCPRQPHTPVTTCRFLTVSEGLAFCRTFPMPSRR
ncbi:hypothetical protein OKW28_004757 [Paraburkholderia sp. 40]